MFWVADRKAVSLAAMPPPLQNAFESFAAVIVTGGSSGIGKSFIRVLHTLNPDLCFCNLSRRSPGIKSAGLKLCHHAIDLAEPMAVAGALPVILAWLQREVPAGKVLLINNSGFGGYGYFPAPSATHQSGMIDLNVRAVVELTAGLLPVLKQRGGAIINVASTAAFQPTAYMSVYGATKAFVLHWSLALDQEIRREGVPVLALCPGPTATEFFRRAGLQPGSVADALSMDSETVVMTALAALTKGRAVVVTGWKNKLGAALVTKLPKTWAAWLAARVLARFRLKQAGGGA